MKFEEAFSKYPPEVKSYYERLNKLFLGQRIVDVEYGPDCEGDPQIYYFILENGIKIGIAKVYLEPDDKGNAIVEEEDRQKFYIDEKGKYILKFQFHNCPVLGMDNREQQEEGEDRCTCF